jgi:putative hydroxymethylpyrimidine transport system substrate-binding protein
MRVLGAVLAGGRSRRFGSDKALARYAGRTLLDHALHALGGQVDAVIGAFRNFELNQMAIEGIPGRCFYPEEHGLPAYDELIYIANPETMDADALRRFLAATERAVQYIVNHPQQSWEIFAATSAELDDELNRRAWIDTLPRLALRPAALDSGRYARFESFLFAQGLLEQVRPVRELAVDLGAQ